MLALFESGAITESEFARRAGTKQPWLHRYARGEGQATIDEVIRIAAVAAGVQATPLNEPEIELVRLWRALKSDDERDDVLVFLRARGRPRQKESAAPAERTPQATAHKARGRR